ncbi:MAG: hypothetical protein SCH71_14465 [Desulfobulbaceae bacterium]|nr:hypothetical protein [Desulfobulbaceae bacterium]
MPTRSVHAGQTGAAGSCADFFAVLDKQIEQNGVLDPGVFRVKNYPYLRVDRFTASLRPEIEDEAAFTEWIDRMQALDQEARTFETANLPDSAIMVLDPVNGRSGVGREIPVCGDILQAADFKDTESRKKLQESVFVPDDYIPLRRVLGLYPLTGLFVSQGVSRWHDKVHKSFSPGPPVGWQSIRYFPSETLPLSAVQTVPPIRRDTLGIPVYSLEELDNLFRTWAPVWEIRIKGDYDHIGEPVWTGSGNLRIDTGRPLTYTLPSFTRFGKEILTQLNYIIWFPSRPKQGMLDIYGGFLDGLNYRVTLDSNGEAILFETMHNCGCYYKAYPTERLQVREKIDYAEPPLILRAPDMNPAKSLMTVAMESGTHYVQHLYPSPRKSGDKKERYSFADYNRLRSLPCSATDRRSMFRRDSLVPESRRLERFILWPTGVLSPGAMRQWGRHAVAFVGSRNFDDPFFMDRMFLKKDGR